ncbi:GntR family transcriptional regulator [Corynebacterium mayonis]|uniref:GntR family transcriptional regulator n=1 Tax=Corynebacterium mayonis TaxID=3062461 RepID=UPI00314007F2
MNSEVEPLFSQVATYVEDLILEGHLAQGARVPSTNELASFHGINPATARKGLAILVGAGIIETRRGIGNFVASGAREEVQRRRRQHFPAAFIAPLIDEALRLGYDKGRLQNLIDRVAASRGMYK